MFVQARKPKYQKKEPRKTRKRSSPQRPVIPDLTPPPQRIPVVSRPVTKRSVRIPGSRWSRWFQESHHRPVHHLPATSRTPVSVKGQQLELLAVLVLLELLRGWAHPDLPQLWLQASGPHPAQRHQEDCQAGPGAAPGLLGRLGLWLWRGQGPGRGGRRGRRQEGHPRSALMQMRKPAAKLVSH